MSKIKVAGIKRKTKFSPNHIGNDGMIFSETAECLRNMGYDVREYAGTNSERVDHNQTKRDLYHNR